ncbi:MAG: hypothetical protein HPY73_00285 [Methanomassiliicoccales archaeon]|nr:MAG: hypothetical protein HPY73_00285 [Methanomassiliicoccales archaeon]
MAKKRIITIREESDKDDSFQEPEEMTWGQWFKSKLILYWFVVLSLMTGSFVSLEINRKENLDFKYLIIVIFLLTFSFIQIIIYSKLWGKNGIWRYQG